jgi:hypothetical protein
VRRRDEKKRQNEDEDARNFVHDYMDSREYKVREQQSTQHTEQLTTMMMMMMM